MHKNGVCPSLLPMTTNYPKCSGTVLNFGAMSHRPKVLSQIGKSVLNLYKPCRMHITPFHDSRVLSQAEALWVGHKGGIVAGFGLHSCTYLLTFMQQQQDQTKMHSHSSQDN